MARGTLEQARGGMNMTYIDTAAARSGSSEVLQEHGARAHWQAPVMELAGHLMRAFIEVNYGSNLRYLSRSEQRALKAALYSSARIVHCA